MKKTNNIKRAILPILASAGMISGSYNANAENIALTNDGGSGKGTGGMNIKHQSGGFEGSGDDAYWTNSIANPTQPEMKITSKPYGPELVWDSRPLNSQTMFHAELSAVNRGNPSDIINTSTNKVIFNVNQIMDTNRLYLVKAFRDAAWNPSGQDITQVTNLITAMGGVAVNKFYNLRFPGVTNDLPSGTVYGTVDVSCKFTNQFSELGNRSSITNDLSSNQVSGLTYGVGTVSGDATGLVSIVNGTNLVYTPSEGTFVGSNNVPINLSWVNGGSNYLGTINYQFGVTNQPAPNNPPLANNSSYNLGKSQNINGNFSVSDSDGSVTNIVVLDNDGKLVISGVTGFSYNALGVVTNRAYNFHATDDKGANSTTNTLSFNSTNTPPVVTGQWLTNLAGLSGAVVLLGSDADGDELAFSVTIAPAHGAVSGSGSNRVYTAEANYHGADEFSFTASDGAAVSAAGLVQLWVLASNRIPVISGISALGATVSVSGQVQPNREVVLEAKTDVGGGSWTGVNTQSMAWSTNPYVPYGAVVTPTNGSGFFRLRSTAP